MKCLRSVIDNSKFYQGQTLTKLQIVSKHDIRFDLFLDLDQEGLDYSMIGLTNLKLTVSSRPLSVIRNFGITESVVRARFMYGEGSVQPRLAQAAFSFSTCCATSSTGLSDMSPAIGNEI